MRKDKRFLLYDNGGKTIDRYTLVDTQSADIMNGETWMQCTSFSIDFDTPLWVVSHDGIYPENLDLLGKKIGEDSVPYVDWKLMEACTKIVLQYHS
jgi:hypothetical protein